MFISDVKPVPPTHTIFYLDKIRESNFDQVPLTKIIDIFPI